MTDAPERIWAFYAPHIADDESGATIVAYTEKQHGGHEFIRADLHDAHLAALRDRVEALSAEVERLTALVPRPEQTDDEILWRDYMRGISYERLAKERGVTREGMRHRLNDIARRLLALRGLEKP